uniref:IBH1-like N-terminal domain-containing protein n=1 Tax=Davidia involucrata TaxID=16924 RepID=A0A5B7C1H8_DAVIN
MQCNATKQKRACSLEPTKLLHAAFARKYVNYLVPALQNIHKDISSEEKDNGELKTNKVRYEVDMALAMSADAFAWSHALKDKLQTGVNQKDRCNIIEENVNDDILPIPHLQKSLVYTQICTNPKFEPKNTVKLKSSRRLRLQGKKRKEKELAEKESEEEEKQITSRLANLRNLLPGGDVMGVDDEMLTEVASYLACLELQVNILRCLVETH